ncbi:Uma2 family endonuclease [Streptomyces sp. NPDC005522]|uniref:Uma2 family endonuclease n=1 Tax=unclassified Streptomyces TaxID=2593676 RepID=UPI0033A41FB1
MHLRCPRNCLRAKGLQQSLHGPPSNIDEPSTSPGVHGPLPAWIQPARYGGERSATDEEVGTIILPPALRPRPGNLREVASQIESATGLRVEIIGGSLVMPPTPRGKHAGTIRRVRVQIEPLLPANLAPYEMSSVAMPEDPDDYATPDLAVLPVEWDEDDSWLADPGDAALVVEVISQSEKAKDITDKNGWYARAGASVLLVLDPRTGRWVLHTHPKDGEYHGRLDGIYGEDIELPAPLPSPIDTSVLPRYGSS